MYQSDEFISISRFLYINKGKITYAVLVVVLSSFSLLPMGFLTKKLVDQAIQTFDQVVLITYSGVMLALILINMTGSILIRRFVSRLVKAYMYTLRVGLCERILSFSREEAERRNISGIQVRTVAHIERIDVMMHAIILVVLPGFIMIVGSSIVLLIINMKLAVIVLLITPTLGVILYLGRRKFFKRIEAYHGAYERFNSQLLDTLRGIFLIQDEGLQKSSLSELDTTAGELRDSGYVLGALGFNQRQIQEALISIMGVFILVVGGLSIFQGLMTIGGLLGFYFVVFIIRRYFGEVVRSVPQIQEGITSYKQVSKELNHSFRPIVDENLSQDQVSMIHLNEVSYWYNPEVILFSNVEITFVKGKTYLISGENGSGKTTLFNLLTANYSPKGGRISYLGLRQQTLSGSEAKLRMGLLSQDPFYFNRSIKDNILLNRKFDGDHFLKVVEMTGVDDFVRWLPKKYDTSMGDEGVFLSGGQKQKIALARALIKGPDFLLLDEPTNHLDRKSVSHLIELLASLAEPPGIIVISHDESMKVVADECLIMVNGTIERDVN